MRCKNCGWENPYGSTQCVKCGSVLEKGKASAMQFEVIEENPPLGEIDGGWSATTKNIHTSNVGTNIPADSLHKVGDRPSTQRVGVQNVTLDGESTQYDSSSMYKQPRTPNPAPKVTRKNSIAKKKRNLRILLPLLILGLLAVVILFFQNQPLSYANEANKENFDKAKVETLIQNICKNSSKGGNYSELQNYYTPIIQPYSSEDDVRYNSSVAVKTESYVEKFSKYEISPPYDFKYKNSSFPLTVECTVQVEWVKKEKLKKAIVYKTFYITEDYKVSGFLDETYYSR